MQTDLDLRWDDVRVLLALWRAGSLKRAADELTVNISTVSRRLDALEGAVGVQLFDRTPEGTLPTAAAEDLLAHAEAMEQAAHGLLRGAQQLESEVEGNVVVTAPPGVVDHFLAPALVELVDQFPRLTVSVLSSIGYADLTRREADIALRFRRPTAGDLVFKRVASEAFALIASPKLATKLGRLRDLDVPRWVTWDDDLAHLPDRRFVDQHVDASRVVFRCSAMSALIEAVRAGLGVMLMPPSYAALRGLTLVRCAPKVQAKIDALPSGPLWLVGHRAQRRVPRVAAVWNWLDGYFENRGSSPPG